MPVALLQVKTSGRRDLFNRLRAEGVSDLAAHLDKHPSLLERAMALNVVEEVNDRAIQMFSARDASELIGSTARLWGESPATFRRALESAFRGESLFQEEMKVATLDGRAIDVIVTIARPGLGMNFVSFIDITERVRAQEMLHQLQANFAHTARISMLGELTASIAHEINQPLAALTMNGQAGLRWLNRAEPDVARASESIQRVVDDARRAADIIARIRVLAAGRAPQQTTLSLHDVIEESMVFLRHELQSKGIVVRLDLGPALPQVRGDRTLVQQVIVNLAINAAQAMAQRGTMHRILAVRTTLGDANAMNCTLEDSGPGIRTDDLDRLFDSFFTTKEGGMGMGLPISRSIIEAHGGQIWVDNTSAYGGARFTFTLPAAAAAAG